MLKKIKSWLARLIHAGHTCLDVNYIFIAKEKVEI